MLNVETKANQNAINPIREGFRFTLRLKHQFVKFFRNNMSKMFSTLKKKNEKLRNIKVAWSFFDSTLNISKMFIIIPLKIKILSKMNIFYEI